MAQIAANPKQRSIQHLDGVVTYLAEAALAPASSVAYSRTWESYVKFCQLYTGCKQTMPIGTGDLARYIAFLFESNNAPSTIRSKVAHISFLHKSRGWPDPADTFLIKKVLRGCSNLGPSGDDRLPITGEILIRMIKALPCPNYVWRMTMRGMFLLAFHGFLRVGEITTRSLSAVSANILRRSDVVFFGVPCQMRLDLHLQSSSIMYLLPM